VYPNRTINWQLLPPYRDRERNSAPSCDPCEKRECNSKHDDYDHGAGSVEALVPQKDGESGAIEKQAGNQN
jgi:hypothetical protein